MRKVAIITVLVFLLLYGQTVAYKGETNGYGEWEWGKPYEDVKSQLVLDQYGYVASSMSYKQNNVVQEAYGQTQDKISYGFENGQFVFVTIKVHGTERINVLKESLLDKHGDPDEEQEGKLAWKGAITTLRLWMYYDKVINENTAVLEIFSTQKSVLIKEEVLVDYVQKNKLRSKIYPTSIDGVRIAHDYDKFRDITFVDSPVERLLYSDEPDVRIYLAFNNDQKWYFLRLYVESKSWLFIDQVIFLIGDDRYTTPVYDSTHKNVTHNTYAGGVYEVIDFKGSEIKSIVEAIARASLSTVIEYRCIGENRNIDVVMTKEEQIAIKTLYRYFLELPQKSLYNN